MKVHSENRILPYSPQQMFDLVADVGRYPEFLPWCVGARIRESGPDWLLADLMIGFKMVREKFTSRVTLDRNKRAIDVVYIEGPFRHLKNRWTFSPAPLGQCQVDFHLEFEFNSAVLQKLIGVLFHEAVRRMVAAFEARAHALYAQTAK
jgi:coenzyme Q-binding protein COQ10